LRTFTVVKLEIHPFSADDVPAAGRLLAQRHRRQRELEPLLAPRFEDADVAAQEVAAVLATDGAVGAVATRGGDEIGYLLGSPKSDTTWGPNVWVESAGQATTEAETMRDLYAVAATEWVERGLKAQYVVVPATDPSLLDAWYRLGFGQQHAHALRPLLDGPPARPREGVVIRLPERSDIPALARLDVALPTHQGLAPTFSAGTSGTVEESIEEWESDFDDPDFRTFVAEKDGQVIGAAVGCALEKSSTNNGLLRPDNAGFLGFAAVFPEARGLGAGRALGEAVIAWCGEAGFTSVATNWRVTNLLSSRAWPGLGWRPSFLRLHRLIGY